MARIPKRLRRRLTPLRPHVIASRRIFRKHWTPTDLAWGQVSFSQFGEDLFLEQFFNGQNAGFYVDVGALHPFHMSNTLLLYRAGWRGINIEPDPDGCDLFRRYRPRDINLDCAVSSSEGRVDFVVDGSFSGIRDDTYLWSHEGKPTICVETRPLRLILDEHLPPRVDIDFLCVDCEGHDYDALISNDWDRYRPRLIAAESHAAGPRDPAALLADFGYEPMAQFRLTHFFERKS